MACTTNVQGHSNRNKKINTKVVGIPTDSAALKAMVKFLFLSVDSSVSYGIWSLRYV